MKDPSEMKVEELKSELKKRKISIDSKDKKADLHDKLVAILETEKVEKTEVPIVDDAIEIIDAVASQDDKAAPPVDKVENVAVIELANVDDQQTVELPDSSSSFTKSEDSALTTSIVKDTSDLNGDIVAIASGAEITVADTVIEDSNKEQNVTEKSYHVRIDNFQRPLTDKLLFEWLAKTLGHEVLKENLWMNKIKTHCYIDFESVLLAQACITAVTGSKVDSKHTMQLVADMTDVSAQEAETSPEAKMKPNEWKNNRNSSIGLIPLPQKTKSPIAVTAHTAGSSIDVVNNDVILKAVNHQLAASNSNKNSQPRNPNAGESIRGNEQIGFSTRRNRINNGTGITKSTEDVSLKRQRLESIGSEDVVLQGRKVNDENEDEDAIELDTLFRKTKAIPPLYWLPITDDIIKLRKEHMMKNK